MRTMTSSPDTGSLDSNYLFRTCRDLVASVTVGGGGDTGESSSSFVSSISVSPCPFCTIAAMSPSESFAAVMTPESTFTNDSNVTSSESSTPSVRRRSRR